MAYNTPYTLAWEEFKNSREFQRLMEQQRATVDPRVEDVYLENRIRCAFDAGWNMRAAHEAYGLYSSASREVGDA